MNGNLKRAGQVVRLSQLYMGYDILGHVPL